MNNYIIHTAIKCSDGKVHRLSYDLIKQTEGSVQEFGRMFTEIEKRFPDTNFCIEQYPENLEISPDGETFPWDSENMITIHGSRDDIFPQTQHIQTMKSE